MPTILEHTPCPNCGHRHHFCLPDGAMQPGRAYEFVCPETGKPASFNPPSPGKAIAHPPQGAVHLKPTPAAAP